MILCLDVGNSHILGGVFNKQELVLQFRHPSDEKLTSDQLGVFFHALLQANHITPNMITHIGYCSVVPSLDYSIRAAFIKYFKLTPFILKPGIKTGLKIKCKNPHEIGSDRIANAIAALNTYPKHNLIIIDFGTATTVDVITANAEYLGGAIIPGIKISMQALHTQTAKLAPVQIKKPRQIIGQTTTSNIQTGLFYGHLGSVREIISQIKQEAFADQTVFIIGTGGFASLFVEENLFDTIIAELSLQGILLSLQRNQELAKQS